MKATWNIIAIVALLNLLAIAGFVGWLYTSGRLDSDRYQKAVAMFSPTIEEEKAAAAAERKKEEALRVEQEKIAHLKRVEQGPVTLLDRLTVDQQMDELAMHKLSRLQTEVRDLRQGLEMQNRQLAMERQKLAEDRQAYEAYHARRQAMLESEDFQQAVEMLEQVKPAQGKQILQDLAARGKMDQVVQYMAAMDLRKSAAILREFKTPQEVSDAATLVERIRQRQSEALEKQTAAAASDMQGQDGNNG